MRAVKDKLIKWNLKRIAEENHKTHIMILNNNTKGTCVAMESKEIKEKYSE